MEVNVGIKDRLARIAGAVIIVLIFLLGWLPGNWGLLLIISGTLIMSATTGYCPLYRPLGINTAKKQADSQ